MHWRYVIAIAAIFATADAGATSRLLLSGHENASMSGTFVVAMTRTRLAWLIHGGKPLGQPIEPENPRPSRIPFYWDSDDGSSIRRMADGSFWLEEWSARANWARMITCYPAGWPRYECSDGTARSMSAPDLNTMNFGGNTFTRMLPQIEPAMGTIPPEVE